MRREWWLYIAVGGLVGVASALSPGSMFVLGLVGLVAWVLSRRAEARQRRFLIALFLIGFVVRALLSVSLDVGSRWAEGEWAGRRGPPQGWHIGIVDKTREYVKMGDGDYVSQRGYALAQFAQGVREPVVVFRIQQSYASNGYAYLIGAFYTLFGFSPYAVKLLNCFLGALLGPVIFSLSKQYFQSAIARWAACVVTFFPSLMVWSATNLKEPSVILLMAVVLWLCMHMQQTSRRGSRISGAIGIACALLVLTTLRPAAFAVSLGGCALLPWALTWGMRRWWRGVLIGGLVSAAIVFGYADPRPMLAKMFSVHSGHVTTPGISYQYLPKEFYASNYVWEWARQGKINPPVMIGMGKALAHYLLEPFPWRMDNVLAVLVYPQMVFWYFLLPFAFLGIVTAIRKTLGLVLPLVAWIIIGALTSGNVGTVFRMRDMVTPFVVIFACAQVWVVVHGPRGLNRELDAGDYEGPDGSTRITSGLC